MNKENKIILILILFIIIVWYLCNIYNMNEKFTPNEMKDYPRQLQINCKKNKENLEQLKEMNKKTCNTNGNTQRDTINNKTLCYDDTAKEIVSMLDTESNCVVADLNNKKGFKPVFSKSELSITPISEFPNPNFINNNFIPMYESKKAYGYSNSDFQQPLENSTNRYLILDNNKNVYDDKIGYNDPSFLYAMTNYVNKKV